MTRMLTATLCLLALAPAVRGDLITYHFTTDSQGQQGYAPRFDPSLGTLTEADFHFDQGAGGTGVAFASGPFSGYATAILANAVIGTGQDLTFFPTPSTITMPFSSNGSSLFAFDGNVSYDVSLTDPGTLLRFVGSPGHDLLIEVISGNPMYTLTSGTTLGPPHTVAFGAGGPGTLTYTYSPAASVPEPPSWVLGVVGVMMMGMAKIVNRRG